MFIFTKKISFSKACQEIKAEFKFYAKFDRVNYFLLDLYSIFNR